MYADQKMLQMSAELYDAVMSLKYLSAISDH